MRGEEERGSFVPLPLPRHSYIYIFLLLSQLSRRTSRENACCRRLEFTMRVTRKISANSSVMLLFLSLSKKTNSTNKKATIRININRWSFLVKKVRHNDLRVACVAGIRGGRERGFWAPLAFLSRPKSPFPSPSNACHVDYCISARSRVRARHIFVRH